MHSSRYYKRRILSAVIVLILLGFGYLARQQGWLGGAGKTAQQDQPGLYSINHFIDGDTIAVNMNGKSESVRFVGVDTPETHKPNTPVQCYGPAAAAFTKSTIGTGKVRLESDPLSTNRDRYNRLLRYVYLPDGTLLNEKLIQQGYGFYYPYFPFSKSKQFAADEQAAIAARIGLWANCHPTPTDEGGYTSNTQGT
jgi:micrococcal nuclease